MKLTKRDEKLSGILISPAVYSFIIPLILIDIWSRLFQWLCFPIYKISKVDRAQYMVFDRGQLKYLSLIERINCNYCAYANGLIAYVREIASRTEQYFCPIKHSQDMIPSAHSRYCDFFRFGDSSGYRKGLLELRNKLK